MSGVRVRALSVPGSVACRRVMELSDVRGDLATKRLFRETVESDEPFVVVLRYRVRAYRVVLSTEHLTDVIVKQLSSMGLVRGLDYEVDVL